MSTPEQKDILVRSGDYEPTRGILHLVMFNQGERTTRAIKALAGFWALAGISVFIIIAHWFLVPAFLIAGPVAAYRRYTTETNAEKATGTCPVHNGEFTMSLEAGDKLPIWKPCPECNAPLNLVEPP